MDNRENYNLDKKTKPKDFLVSNKSYLSNKSYKNKHDINSKTESKLEFNSDLKNDFSRDFERDEDKDISLKMPVFERIICKETEEEKEEARFSYLLAYIFILVLIFICYLNLKKTYFSVSRLNTSNASKNTNSVIRNNKKVPIGINYKKEIGLHLAVINNNVEEVKDLLQKNYDMNKKDIYGNTPLHYVAKCSPNEMMLYEFYKYKEKMDLSIVNNEGKTPRDIADFDCFEFFENNIDTKKQ